MQDFETLLARHEAISSHLLKRSSDDQAYEVRHNYGEKIVATYHFAEVRAPANLPLQCGVTN